MIGKPVSSECMICGEGEVVEKEEKNHETTVAGMKMTLPEAIVGTCNKCGVVNYAFNKDVWLKAQEIHKSEKEYGDHREAQGWKRGYNSALVDVKGSLAKLDQMTSNTEFRQKVREFTDQIHSV